MATLTLWGPLSAHAASAESYAAVREAFQQAYARAALGQTDSSGDSAQLRHYPLYPYLEAARIREALNELPGQPGQPGQPGAATQADERAAEFVSDHANEPVSRGLRRAWLESLARRERWDVFLAEYRDADATDALRCRSFTARIALGRREGLAQDIQRAWLTPTSVPECAGPFAWLTDGGLLTPELIGQRARLALAAGNPVLASEIALRLPAEESAPLLQWAALLESPATSIDTLLASAGKPVDPAALLAGWSRLARKDPAAAEARYASLVVSRVLSGDGASEYALALALGLAWDRDPAALEYFERVAPRDLDDGANAWRARAALWSGDWKLAAQAITALSPSERQTARWRYWAARVSELLHDTEHARKLYESVLADDDFYSAMAAARLHRAVSPHPLSLPLDSELLASLERLPALTRARELFLCGMRPEAEVEWSMGIASLSGPERLQAIHLAAGWGWYEQAIQAATAQRVFNDYVLLYPRPFDDAVRAASRRAGLSPEIVYGVIRQESLYRSDAVSSAGARGLMQLQPQTARRTARFSELPRSQSSDLFDPQANILLGAERLKMLLDQFDGQLPVALAAYNAGPNAAGRWLPAKPIEPDIWIENIPYNETREYVERVLWHSLVFTWLREGGDPQRVDAWLDPIRSASPAG